MVAKKLNVTKYFLPSVELSQKQELAVCKPAPFFCMITQVTEIEQRELNQIMITITGEFCALNLSSHFCDFQTTRPVQYKFEVFIKFLNKTAA